METVFKALRTDIQCVNNGMDVFMYLFNGYRIVGVNYEIKQDNGIKCENMFTNRRLMTRQTKFK